MYFTIGYYIGIVKHISGDKMFTNNAGMFGRFEHE